MEQLQAFINQWTGKEAGTNGINTGQCVGLVMLWVQTLSLDWFPGNAIDLITNAPDPQWTKFYNDPNDYTQFPLPGDILVFGPPYGHIDGVYYGHTGVIVNANGSTFDLFEQNNPAGHLPVVTHYSSYMNVIGWIRAILKAPQTQTNNSSTQPAILPVSQWTQDWQVKAVAANEDVNSDKYANFRNKDLSIALTSAQEEVTSLQAQMKVVRQKALDDVRTLLSNYS